MRRSLFVIIDPTKDSQPALERAQTLAPLLDADIIAFYCVYTDDIGQFTSRHDAKHSTLIDAKEKLKTLTQSAKEQGIVVHKEVCWNQRWYQSAIMTCTKLGADIVLLNSTVAADKGHILNTQSDRYILRNSPCPILLCTFENNQPYKNLMAAIAVNKKDTEHVHLNNRIVASAQLFRRALKANLDLVSAADEGIDIAQALNIVKTPEDSNASMLAMNFGIDPEHTHIEEANPVQLITEKTVSLKSDLLIIGTMARKGISAAVLGNTSESVLRAVKIDALVIN